MVARNRFETEFGRSVPMAKFADYQGRYHSRFVTQVKAMSVQAVRNSSEGPRDLWNTPLRVARSYGASYYVTSAGPDKAFNTADDLSAYVEIQGRKNVGKPSSGPSRVEVEIEHDRGPFNGRAEVVGSVLDQWGGALEGAVVSLGPNRSAIVNAEGRFRLAAIPAGDYEVKVTSASDAVSRKIALNVRDSAVLAVMIRKQSGGSRLMVVDSPRRMLRDRVAFGGGVAGGVMGGRESADDDDGASRADGGGEDGDAGGQQRHRRS
jgi:hypothetical protein